MLAAARLPKDAVPESAPLEELAELADTAGAVVADRVVQKRRRFDAATLFGHGKVEEIGRIAAAVGADLVITENELSPAQIRNIERIAGKKVVDRTELILDIFATRARTVQAKVQVELAQLEYLLPRLVRMWVHLERIEGGIGTRGPGETQLETDRRIIRNRIAKLRAELREIEARRRREVATRAEQFTVALVGYTNAGKSTLMRRLTGADVLVEDRLFSTLDTRSRAWALPGGRTAILSDTVGFIRNLPHRLVASFHATLEEALTADLLLHVADASHRDVEGQVATVEKVLSEVGAGERCRLLVLNKMDRVEDHTPLSRLRTDHGEKVEVSALRGDGIEALAARVAAEADRTAVTVDLLVPYADGARLARIRAHGRIISEEAREDGIRIRASLPPAEAIRARDGRPTGEEGSGGPGGSTT